ncbi:MAG: pyridoxal-phosphate dependent enzyme [Gammaproteobacteria bacterium]|nr:pyridoxal-phosphate dependent enzyme [Gammaproteobacteria bacterium]
MTTSVPALGIEAIDAARARLAHIVVETPLLPLELPGVDTRVFLKLENLQHGGSFKLRPAANAVLSLPPAERARGVFTASTGNLGIGMAWIAARLGIPADVVVRPGTPAAKLAALVRLGATVHEVSAGQWWEVVETRRFPALRGRYIDGAGDPEVIEGNATIGAEILDRCPEVDTVLVPFGAGALACGIAAACRARDRRVRVVACECDVAAPLAAARAAGRPVCIEPRPSFISGVGVATVLAPMWPWLETLIDASVVVPLADVAAAIRRLATQQHLIAEGAGAVPVAAALAGAGLGRHTVCVVSGANIDPGDLATILAGGIPGNGR